MATPEDPRGPVLEDDPTQTHCYRHPDVPTKLSCSRCGRPICGDCATPASVGQHCPECVAEARRTTRKARSALVATAPVVVGLIVANVIVYLFQFMTPGSGIERDFGLVPPAIADGEWWRLFSAMFLHSPNAIFHIVFNMIVLAFYGPDVERAFGHVRFAAMYVVTGFVASATSYALAPCNILGVGASGAIFGVVGVLLVFLHNRSRSQFVASYRNNLLAFLGINVVFGFIYPGIDWRAHLGGLVAGALLGFGIDSVRGRASKTLQLAVLTAVAVIGVFLVSYRTETFTCGPGLFG